MPVPMVVEQKSVEAANIRVPLPTRVLDFFRNKNEVTVEWSTGHRQVTLFWGLITYERVHARARFIIRGKPGFIQAVIEDLKANGTIDAMY
jgi:hypothetical protein